jgi:thiol-disulfide isomerase/thioredoxin
MLTTPEREYKNSVVLYHWRKCGHCVRFHPEWRKAVKTLPRGTKVYEIEVNDKREVLNDMGVDLGGGVPRVVAYNSEGDEMVYEGTRTAEDVGPALSAHLITVSPAAVPHPSTVLYFRHNCGYCVRFLPEYLQFARRGDANAVVAVDTARYPAALASLDQQATGVPHVVYYNAEGKQTVFSGERTVSGLKSFVASTNSGRGVNFEGGSFMPSHDDARMGTALDRLQERASVVLGSKYSRTFEPENASVCFIGSRGGGRPTLDRTYIMLCPDKTPRGKPGVSACVYGSRDGPMTVKIYVGRDTDTLLRNKRKSGFHPVLETNPHVQSLRTFGYHVELS